MSPRRRRPSGATSRRACARTSAAWPPLKSSRAGSTPRAATRAPLGLARLLGAPPALLDHLEGAGAVLPALDLHRLALWLLVDRPEVLDLRAQRAGEVGELVHVVPVGVLVRDAEDLVVLARL